MAQRNFDLQEFKNLNQAVDIGISSLHVFLLNTKKNANNFFSLNFDFFFLCSWAIRSYSLTFNACMAAFVSL